MEKRFWKGLISFVILSVIVVAVSLYFVSDNKLIGPVFLFVGVINLIFLKFLKIEIKTIYPDIIFGAIDNGVLIFAAIIGGAHAGIVGAVIGGAAGNTITDGIAGLFEGHMAEKLRRNKVKDERNAISASLGKMAGCLLGAGLGLILVWLISVFSPFK